jgi:archaellum component FlaC
VSIFGNSELPVRTRVSLLEERLASYDEISKQMLNKLEQAVEKISESTRNISQILIRHEERIDRASEANAALIQLINKTENELNNKIEKTVEDVKEQVDANSIEIEDLKKGKWIWVGVVMAVSFFVSQLRIFDNIHLPLPPGRPGHTRQIQ